MADRYTLVRTKPAIDDLKRIYRYGAKRYGRAQADLYIRKLNTIIRGIGENPFQYPAVDHIKPGYRRAICGRDSIWFTITHNQIVIMRILCQQNLDDAL